MTVHIQDSPALAYRLAGETHDLDALMATLADDVIFRSPLSSSAGFRGKEQVRELFSVVFGVISDLRYQTDIGDERTRALTATARLGRLEMHEAVLLEVGEDGLITEVTMWIRPLPALTAMMAALGPGMARATGRRGLPLLVGAAVRPLAAMTRFGDKVLVPLLTRRG
ncbi:SnoaL-like domain-containing protein [Nonomuraea solani]|uniref:SnoaL-like domain-containing protein n=1 Tax=Nonomuraea solani TaxID=1144553 RepID=A0A1H6EUQ1_9ACTN|nr:nuclear transport factor 2 family protein [Nonomuraea solani]SEH01532.1 SnoaL-like domain-containing protein [Nonomuraea solani]